MHLLGAKSVLKAKIAFKPWDSAASLKQIDLLLTKAREVHLPDGFDAMATEILKMKKTFIENNPVPYDQARFPNDHLLHGDYHDANVFFDERDEVTHVFDFDKSGYGPRTYEIFRAMKYSLICGDDTDEILANAKAYMDAYRGVYPISSDEIAAGLQALHIKTMHGLWVESEHYLSGNSRTDRLLPFELARLKFLSGHLEDLISSLADY